MDVERAASKIKIHTCSDRSLAFAQHGVARAGRYRATTQSEFETDVSQPRAGYTTKAAYANHDSDSPRRHTWTHLSRKEKLLGALVITPVTRLLRLVVARGGRAGRVGCVGVRHRHEPACASLLVRRVPLSWFWLYLAVRKIMRWNSAN